MPRTAVPRKVVIEPEPSTTTPFPEATGQMREGWSQAVGIGRFYHVLSQCWAVNWFTYMVTLGGWNDPDFHASIFKRDKPGSWWKQSPKQRVWLSIWTTVSFSMRKRKGSHVFKSWWEAPHNRTRHRHAPDFSPDDWNIIRDYTGLMYIFLRATCQRLDGIWYSFSYLFVTIFPPSNFLHHH